MGLELVEIVMEVEQTFGIDLSDDEIRKIETVGEFQDVLVEAIESNKHGAAAADPSHPSGWTPAEAREKLREIIADVLGVPLVRVTPDARLVKDLGAG